ncbi:hypothetical protein HMPREF3213_04077 [Heyndrickxia coagulans]|uniref:Uncharacterized protein n=1 Tax=Heyndrickxia coagulans TaxID=1398 RepID=A0A133K9C3_HEYCO|nr:hypothetical protein HMPREF3213_04077 [Heyndrickxia coagulans]
MFWRILNNDMIFLPIIDRNGDLAFAYSVFDGMMKREWKVETVSSAWRCSRCLNLFQQKF